MWFTPNKIFSYNCLLNFVVSMRGAGKTFGSLRFIINKCLKDKCQFVYIRRTDKEVAKVRDKMLNALYAEQVLDEKIYAVSDTIYLEQGEGKEKTTDIIGYILPLNLAKQYKSSAFPKVKYVLFDEFISEDNQYLTDEVDKFLSLFETICRARTDVKALLLGNLSTCFNPYFLYWNVRPSEDKEFTIDRQRGIAVQHFRSPEFKKKKADTPFARLIAGTQAGDFILNNTAILDDNELVKKIKGRKNQLFSFTIEGHDLSVFEFWDDGIKSIYIDNAKSRAYEHFNFDKELTTNFNVAKNSWPAKLLKRNARAASIWFADAGVKQLAQCVIF